MLTHAKKLEFEEAQKCRDALTALADLQGYQVVQTEIRGNYIAVQFLEKYGTLYAGVIIIEDSKLISYESYEFEHSEMEEIHELKAKLFEEIFVLQLERSGSTSKFRFLLSESPTQIEIPLEYEIPDL